MLTSYHNNLKPISFFRKLLTPYMLFMFLDSFSYDITIINNTSINQDINIILSTNEDSAFVGRKKFLNVGQGEITYSVTNDHLTIPTSRDTSEDVELLITAVISNSDSTGRIRANDLSEVKPEIVDLFDYNLKGYAPPKFIITINEGKSENILIQID